MRYDAFISYSHAADDSLAPALQRGLQNLARPWNRRRALEIFRDDTGLAVSPGLWSSICAGLDDSAYFVLLASPGAAESVWVNREIDRWLDAHPIDNLLPVVTDGEWVWGSNGDFDWERSTAVPPSLRGLFSEEPRHLDLHWARSENDLDLRNSRFREAVAQLAAPMHSMTPQDLDSADVANYRRVVRLRRAIVLVMAVLLVLVSVAGVLAIRNAAESNRQQDLADTREAEARAQAQLATALRLVAQSEIERPQRKTLSTLLGVEASLRAPAESWGSLIDGLQGAPGLARVFDLPGRVAASEASAIAPDGGVLAAPAGGDIELWNLSTGAAVGHRLKDSDLFPKSPTELVFSRTGLLAGHYVCISVSLCEKKQIGHSVIVVWDPSTRRPRQLVRSDGFASPSFSADGRRLAAYAADGSVRVWDTARGSLIAEGSEAGPASAVALSPDGSMVAVASPGSGHISTWLIDGRQLTARQTMASPGRAPEAVTFSGNHMVASTSRDGRVTVWDVTSGKPIGDLPSAGGVPVVDVTSRLDGTLATVSARGVLRLWDAETQRPLGTPHPAGPAPQGASVAFTADGRLVSVGRDIRVWDVRYWDQSGSVLYRQPGGVTAMAISPSGLLASAGPQGEILLSPGDGGEPPRRIHAGQGPITALAMSSDGLLASGGTDGRVRLWNTDTGASVQDLPSNNQGSIAALAFSPDGAALAVGYHRGPHDPATDDLPVWVWPLASGEVTPLHAGLAERVSALAFASDGTFATAGDDHLTVYDSIEGDTRVLASNADAMFRAIAFSPDGKTLASSGFREGQSRGDTAALWDVSVQTPTQSRLPVAGAPGWDGLFRSLAFSPDGRLLGGAGAGGLQLWDAALREPLGGLLRPLEATSVVFTPDGQSVVVGDARGLVQTYPATIGGWRDTACGVVARNLTESEWATFVGGDEKYRETCPQN